MTMETCIACSMPLMQPEEKGRDTPDGPVCVHCMESNGSVKSCEAVFEGGVEFFMGTMHSQDRALAERLVRKTMRSLPYWQKHPNSCLEGAIASDEEYTAALKALTE